MIDKWKKAVDNSKIECLQSTTSCFKNDTGLSSKWKNKEQK